MNYLHCTRTLYHILQWGRLWGIHKERTDFLSISLHLQTITSPFCRASLTTRERSLWMSPTVWGSEIEPFYINRKAQFRFLILYIQWFLKVLGSFLSPFIWFVNVWKCHIYHSVTIGVGQARLFHKQNVNKQFYVDHIVTQSIQ